jgi:hypothetical protein
MLKRWEASDRVSFGNEPGTTRWSPEYS